MRVGTRLTTALVALTLGLSGCATSPSDDVPPAPAPPSTDAPDSLLALDGCRGIYASATYPTAANPAPVPEGFTPNVPLAVITNNVVAAYECDRLGFQELERPATLIMAYSSVGVAPESCRQGTAGMTLWVMHHAWTNDTDVLAALAGIGWDVEYTEVTSQSSGGSLGGAVWQWDDAGFHFPPPDGNDTDSQPRNRIYWVADSRISFMDVDYSGRSLLATQNVGLGRAPDAYIGLGAEDELVLADLHEDFSVRGEIRSFEGLDCSSS